MSTITQHVGLVLVLLVTFATSPGQARRYRRCREGCCIHEYCAYDLICYPRIHCHFGCPDGYCAGSGQTIINDATKNDRPQVVNPSAQNRGSSQPVQVDARSEITENYSYSDKVRPPKAGVGAMKEREGTGVNSSPSKGRNSQGKQPDGICMPLPPCKKSDYCGMGNSCTFNFNLGYNVCQYNLEIGTTLCYDSHGNYVAKPYH